MESLQRLTRRMAGKLLKEKSLPNRLQRLTTGGFKRKAEFLTLIENKRRKRVKAISPSTDITSIEEEVQLKKGKIGLSEYSVANEEVQIFVELPSDQALSANTLKMNAEVESVESLSDDGDHKPLTDLAKESGINAVDEHVSFEFQPFVLSLAFDTDSEDQSIMNLGKMVEGEVHKDDDDAVTSNPIKPLEKLDSVQSNAVQVFDKMPGREVKIAQVFDKMTDREMPDTQVLDKTAPREIVDAQVFEKMIKREMADAQVFHEMHEGKITDAQACNGSGSLLGCAKEEPEMEGSFPGLDSNKGPLERGGACKMEQLKGLRRLGPGSKWLYSGSRFAAFLRSAVGVIDLDAEEHLLQNYGKIALKQKPDAVCGGCVIASPPKRQSARFPGKRKVALSPSSQLKLLEASKSSSYRRMLPFCTELAKDLAMASSAQSTTKMSPRADFIAPKECDMCTDKGFTREPLLLEHVKGEENESDLASLTRDQGLSSRPMFRTHVELDQNVIKRELPTSDEEISREPHCIGHVKLERNDSQSESTLSVEEMIIGPTCTGHVKVEDNESDLTSVTCDQGLSSRPISRAHVKLDQNGIKRKLPTSSEEISREPQCIGHVKLERNDSQSEYTLSDDKITVEPPCTGHAKVEENGIVMELSSGAEDISRELLCAGHVKSKENGFQMEFVPINEEFSREPLATKHTKLKENGSHSVLAINNGLHSSGLSIGHAKVEQSGSQLELTLSDQCLSRKSLFIEHMMPEQNGNQPELATSDHNLTRESFSTRSVEPEQNQCQSKSASNLLESSHACHLYGPYDLGKNVVIRSSSKPTSLLFSYGQCASPLPMQKSPQLDADNKGLVDLKSPSPSLSGSADFTLFSTHGEVPSPLHTPASVPSKGILKVSPRSCKGVCLCSDCASFRLQAERASEFSERQLRETETLAVSLINELTNVRNVMDKSLIAKSKGARILYSIPHSQLKDACRSALRAEETARNQLLQMTRDCNLHCKILRMQQRRVKFADKVEVKMFKSG